MRHYYLLALLTVIAVECFWFVSYYLGVHPIAHFRRMWPEGKHLTLFSASFGALAAWLVLGEFVPHERFPWITPALVTVIAALLGQRIWLLMKA
ncbi:MAG TPA: hypothetical protein VFX61_13245, partial [Micromonosporaceae bacterium]|nr:hypothetical protein [Micromonosporaceae bacterium]